MSNFGSLFLDEKIHDATLNTADALGISSEIVLKDYAVFGVLKVLFEDSPKDISDRLVFKGGTSLSKAYRLIDRFSEDVDLAFLNQEGSGLKRLGQRRQDSLIRSVETFIGNLDWMDSVNVVSKTQGKRILACSYIRPAREQSVDARVHGYLKPHVQLELDIRGDAFPVVQLPISSLLGDFIKEKNPKAYEGYKGLHPIQVRVMSYERTLIEKSLALLTCITNFFSHVEAKARFSVKEKERHFYDIHRLFEKFKAEGGSMASEELLNIFRSAVEMDGRIYGSQNYLLVNGLPNLEDKIEHFLNIQFQNEYKRHYNSSPIYYGTRLAAEEILSGVEEYLRKLNDCFQQSKQGFGG